MSNQVGGQLRTQYLRVQASNIRADATEAEQDWLEVADSLDDAADEVDQLRKDNDDYDSILIRQGDLLTGVANAVRGAPPALTIWSHADLPERVARLRSVIEKAPHADGCASRIPMHFHKKWPCDCWKADAL